MEQKSCSELYGELKIEAVLAIPYNARSKPIERFFCTFDGIETGSDQEKYQP